jgi:predicted nucleic-acid-binding Zn-ribbon protein
METTPCPKCNELMDEGRLSVSDGTIGYVSTKQKGVVRQVTVIEQARACPKCGYVELYLNPQTLKQRLA